MLRPQPIEPVSPNKNDDAKYELIKAMGVSIAAIAKIKEVFISSASIEENNNYELVIRVHVPEDKAQWDKYESDKSAYNADWNNWVHERDCEKFGITEEQRIEAEKVYYEYRKAAGYPYPEGKSREDFYREASGIKSTKKSEIIEVA